jgi:hypothetical protein
METLWRFSAECPQAVSFTRTNSRSLFDSCPLALRLRGEACRHSSRAADQVRRRVRFALLHLCRHRHDPLGVGVSLRRHSGARALAREPGIHNPCPCEDGGTALACDPVHDRLGIWIPGSGVKARVRSPLLHLRQHWHRALSQGRESARHFNASFSASDPSRTQSNTTASLPPNERRYVRHL